MSKSRSCLPDTYKLGVCFVSYLHQNYVPKYDTIWNVCIILFSNN